MWIPCPKPMTRNRLPTCGDQRRNNDPKLHPDSCRCRTDVPHLGKELAKDPHRQSIISHPRRRLVPLDTNGECSGMPNTSPMMLRLGGGNTLGLRSWIRRGTPQIEATPTHVRVFFWGISGREALARKGRKNPESYSRHGARNSRVSEPRVAGTERSSKRSGRREHCRRVVGFNFRSRMP